MKVSPEFFFSFNKGITILRNEVNFNFGEEKISDFFCGTDNFKPQSFCLCVVMDRIASAAIFCPAFSTPRVCKIKPFGLNFNTDHRKRFSCRVAVASGNTTAKVWFLFTFWFLSETN